MIGGLMKKLCLSCHVPFKLSGSGRPQRYCLGCQKEPKPASPQVRNLSASKPLKSKAAETHFSAPIPPAKRRRRKRSPTRELGAFVLAQIEAQKHKPNPIRF